MAASFKEILTSRIITFKIGGSINKSPNAEKPTEYYVYERAITQLSDPLKALLTGGMSEALAGCIVWEDVDKETFEAFVQFAYMGDYSMPIFEAKPVPETSIEQSPNRPVAQGSGVWNAHKSLSSPSQPDLETPQKRRKVEKAPRTRASDVPKPTYGISADLTDPTLPRPLQAFNTRRYNLLAPRNPYFVWTNVPETFLPQRAISHLMLHASLHALASQHMIPNLQALSLNKLHATLKTIDKLTGDVVCEIVALVRWLYDAERGIDAAEEFVNDGRRGISAVKDMVCAFLLAHKDRLVSQREFRKVLGEGGSLVVDLWMVERNLLR